VHLAVVRSLAEFGIRATPHRLAGRADGKESSFLCFQRRTDEDLILSGYKIVGSAQRRSRGAVLQHGSLLLRASRCAPELPGVCDLTSKQLDAIALVDSVAEQLSELIGVRWNPGQLLPGERGNADRIVAERFAAVGWNRRR
jgi:lipoate-protein ligase A